MMAPSSAFTLENPKAAVAALRPPCSRANVATLRRVAVPCFDSNPLQRCLRDAQAAGQHFAVSRSAYRNFGMFKLGQPDAQPYG